MSSFPQSYLFSIHDIPDAGRGVVAIEHISTRTHLLTAAEPYVNVILHEYQREVCAYCFAYNAGRNHPIRNNEIGSSFCSDKCRAKFLELVEDDGIEALKALHAFTKGKPEPTAETPDQGEVTPPTEEDISAAWDVAEHTATSIRAARTGSMRSKADSKLLRAAQSGPVSKSVLSLLLSGILYRRLSASRWSYFESLVPDPRPYKSSAQLETHVRSYLQLLTLVSTSLLPMATTEICMTMASRDSWNSFGIRSTEDGGDEFFGWGVWPGASFWNHSCDPNIGKERVGRAWKFWAAKEIMEGDELCISYLGGEEKELSVEERRRRLRATWGFECRCRKCYVEERATNIASNG
ncbi:SET domain-containing protein [Patellaria atrata CBS 101060]|uniref:SET domain-containing protein n=1 Tax=Patellaria atrata CBS 101060 TaxID=1346257 RepID=A0A9P4VTG7_9PEZI|nr:SET domain-containing protein [Patellaria atrata CBS 101060]